MNSAGEGAKAGPVTATPADMTPPSLVSALVGPTGTVMVVAFNEIPVSSGATNALANAAFTITADGTSVSFLAGWFNNEIGIEFSSPIRQGQSVVFSYVDPDTTDNFNIRDAAGNETPSFTTGMNGVPAVSNQSTVQNNAPTAEDKTVTTVEDTGYAFQASDFNFADTDTGDALASVTGGDAARVGRVGTRRRSGDGEPGGAGGRPRRPRLHAGGGCERGRLHELHLQGERRHRRERVGVHDDDRRDGGERRGDGRAFHLRNGDGPGRR